jgi:hypothetical protein
MSRGVILVAGALANKCGNGGGAWERLSWAIGLARLGFEVYFVEQIAPEACRDETGNARTFRDSVNLAWFRSVTRWFGLAERATLVYGDGQQCAGATWAELLTLAEHAELLVNLSGHLTLEPVLGRIRRKAYVDVDPGFTQFWHADSNMAFKVQGHDFYFTIGENIGTPVCAIPTGGIHWRATRQPVVLDQWPVAEVQGSKDERRGGNRFTTIASWRGPFGPVQTGGKTFGLKLHEFRKVIELPRRVASAAGVFEIALDIHPADQKDRAALEQNGWRIVDPRAVAGDPAAFRQYVQGSAAEFSVAQGIYVDTHSGWFSDRSVRYLASGRPVLVQDTGFSQHYPVGEGIVPFRTLDEASAGADDIVRNYASHCRAARGLAENYFDSDKVLRRLLDEVGVA